MPKKIVPASNLLARSKIGANETKPGDESNSVASVKRGQPTFSQASPLEVAATDYLVVELQEPGSGASMSEEPPAMKEAPSPHVMDPDLVSKRKRVKGGSFRGIGAARRFEHLASRYGNKTKNLEIINATLGAIPHLRTRTEVPLFFGLSHDFIFSRLNKGGELHELWQEYQRCQPANERALRAESKLVLKKIRRLIAQRVHENNDIGVEVLRKLQRKEFPPQTKLMVRSSSREDSGNLSNAGGNESVAGVEMLPRDIEQALTCVLQSYFSEKSMGQRLLSGDSLEAFPILSVLLQQMVGSQERGRGNPSESSGVLCSVDPETGTPGISRIEATWGHGEGIVTGVADFDTFLVNQAGQVASQIRMKNSRLLVEPNPRGTNSTIGTFPNGEAAAKSPALPVEVARDLHCIAQALEREFEGPVDIEFVWDRTQKTLFVVQVRPLILAPQQASHITRLSGAFNWVQGKCATSGTSSVRRLTEPASEMIVAPTIAQAAREWIRQSDSTGIKAVILRDRAPVSCHEVMVLRAAGIPVIWGEEVFKEAQSLQGRTQLCWVDPQQALLVTSVDRSGGDEIEIQQGWVRYPMDAGISDITMPSEDEIRSMFARCHALCLAHPEEVERSRDLSIRELVAAIESGDAEVARVCLSELARRLQVAAKIESFSGTPRGGAALPVVQKATSVLVSLEEAMEFRADGTRILTGQTLLYGRMLEGLIFHRAADKLVDEISLKDVLEQIQTDRVLGFKARESGVSAGNVHPLLEQASGLLLVSRCIVSKEIAQSWKEMVYELNREGEVDALDSLNRVCVVAQKVGLLEAWLAGNLERLFDSGLERSAERGHGELALVVAEAICNGLSTELVESQPVIEYLESQDANIVYWQERVQGFESSSAFSGNSNLVGGFQFDLATSLDLDTLESIWVDASPALKSVFIHQLTKRIELVDSVLKSIGSSDKFESVEQKNDCFASVLESYHAVLQAYGRLLLFASHESGRPISLGESVPGVEEILRIRQETLQRLLQNERKATNLLPSAYFNVKEVHFPVVGCDFARPKTLEDMFTLVHQDLMGVMSLFLNQSGFEPQNLVQSTTQRLVGNIERLPLGDGRKPTLVAANRDYPKTELLFNCPMRSHSALIRLVEDCRKDVVSVDVAFGGDDENGRWSTMAPLIEYGSEVLGLRFSEGGKPNPSDNALLVGWTLSGDELEQGVLEQRIDKLIGYCMKYSFDVSCDGAHDEAWDEVPYSLAGTELSDQITFFACVAGIAPDEARRRILSPQYLASHPYVARDILLGLRDNSSRSALAQSSLAASKAYLSALEFQLAQGGPLPRQPKLETVMGSALMAEDSDLRRRAGELARSFLSKSGLRAAYPDSAAALAKLLVPPNLEQLRDFLNECPASVFGLYGVGNYLERAIGKASGDEMTKLRLCHELVAQGSYNKGNEIANYVAESLNALRRSRNALVRKQTLNLCQGIARSKAWKQAGAISIGVRYEVERALRHAAR